jgi:dihydrodipicolinate synthase/N-acetylneuraminate lyase
MQLDMVKAVKESNGDVGHRTTVVSHISKRINVFAGGENWLLGDSLVGGNSIVAVVGPGAPGATRKFFDACMSRDIETAVPFHIKFSDIYDEMTAQNEVAWEKACAELGGFRAGPPRSPYAPLDPGIRKRLAARLEELQKMAQVRSPILAKSR